MDSESRNTDRSIRRTIGAQGKEKSEFKTALLFILSGTIVLSCFLFSKYTGKLYIDVDNYYVAMVTAGVFDDINWCYYVNPFLCIVIKLLTNLIPRVDWFTMLTHICVFTGAIWLIFSALTWKEGKLLEKAVFILWIVFLLVGLNLWNINYTVQSAFFCYVGGMGLFYARSSFRGRKILVTLFFLCGLAWRIEVFFLFLPFVILKAVCDRRCFLSGSKKIWPSAFLAGLMAACAVLITAHYAVRLLPQNTEAVRYNRARTAVTDYPMENWEKFPDKTLLSETAYRAITTEWCLFDTEVLNADLLEQVADAGGHTLSLHQALYRLARVCIQNRNSLLVPCSWLLLLGMLNLMQRKRFRSSKTLLAYAGTGLILLFFSVLGRIPISVILSTLLACSLALINPPQDEDNATKTDVQTVLLILMACISTVKLGTTICNAEVSAPQWVINSREPLADSDLYRETVQGEKLFFWDTSSEGMHFHMENGKLMDRQFVCHNLDDGGWTYGQPYLEELLYSINAPNPARALLERENTYYVDEKPLMILELLRSHYGENVQMRQAGALCGRLPYWQFYKNGEYLRDGA